MHAVSLTIQVALEANGDQLRGWIGAEAHQPERFVGWLGLIAAIDDIVLAARDDKSTETIEEPQP